MKHVKNAFNKKKNWIHDPFIMILEALDLLNKAYITVSYSIVYINILSLKVNILKNHNKNIFGPR